MKHDLDTLAARLLPLARPLIVLDAETTGPNPEEDRIVEIGFVQIKPDGSHTTWSSFINPGIPIPHEATFGRPGSDYPGHGITDDIVRACRHCRRPRQDHEDGQPERSLLADDIILVPLSDHAFNGWPTFAEMAPHLLRGFTNCDYGGYNIKSYDLLLLQAEFKRAGHVWSWEGAHVIDGFRIWQIGQKRSLTDAVEFFLHEDHSGAHRAIDDVTASLRVILEQVQSVYTHLPREFDALHQVLWPVDPNAVDPDGKIIWKDGEAVMNFGKKWKGVPLKRMTRRDLDWIVNTATGMSPAVKQICRDCLAGTFPIKKETA